ncbi:MAG: hypothetical protein [Podoviridae sp. ctbd591]|nr:MAG: hypothetical protein [Podoviridae sp. ctbd591]
MEIITRRVKLYTYKFGYRTDGREECVSSVIRTSEIPLDEILNIEETNGWTLLDTDCRYKYYEMSMDIFVNLCERLISGEILLWS